jgi:hypothetical protein
LMVTDSAEIVAVTPFGRGITCLATRDMFAVL